DGHTDYCNERWYEYTGFPRTEGNDPIWEPVFHPDDVQRCKNAWHASVQSGRQYQIEYRFKDRAGGYRWHLGRALPITDEEGRVVRWFGTSTDIEDQKRAEEALLRAKSELEARVQERTAELAWANRELERSNQELQSFAFVASHDLQEPLRKVQAFG